jgi:hypothetical protein
MNGDGADAASRLRARRQVAEPSVPPASSLAHAQTAGAALGRLSEALAKKGSAGGRRPSPPPASEPPTLDALEDPAGAIEGELATPVAPASEKAPEGIPGPSGGPKKSVETPMVEPQPANAAFLAGLLAKLRGDDEGNGH